MKNIIVGTALVALALLAAPSIGARTCSRSSRLPNRRPRCNQKALRSYSWLEKTELRLKGELKNTKVDMCKYGPDGNVQKTPVVEPPPAEKQRGLKGKIVAKKTGEMKDELEAPSRSSSSYVPPSPDMMQVVMNAGTASLSPGGPGRVDRR